LHGRDCIAVGGKRIAVSDNPVSQALCEAQSTEAQKAGQPKCR
jgi:hypothetical protein